VIEAEKILLEQVGQKLRQMRLEKGYSSHETFAFDHNISRVYYWKLEKGKTNFTIRTLQTILDIHGVSVKDFFAGL